MRGVGLLRLLAEDARAVHVNYFVADCATVAEVTQLVDLASMVPEQP
jgi:hypothetical protein